MTFNIRVTLVAVLATAWPHSLGAQVTASPARAKNSVEAACEAASTGVMKLGCYLRAAAKARRKVERSYERILSRAMVFDREANSFPRSHRTPGSALAGQLRASQAAWRAYSNGQCMFEGGSSNGGSGTDILEAACRYRLNDRRLAELEAAARLLDR